MEASEALSLVQQGKRKSVEDRVLEILDDPETDLHPWIGVVEAIAKEAMDETSETLSWAMLNALEQRYEPKDVLQYGAPFLRLFSKSEELRQKALELYRHAYDHEELESLIELSGFLGGKPIRRAMQTLDLCLDLEPGDYLVHKTENVAARVEKVELPSWNVRIRTPRGEELYDPVGLGDQFERVTENDYRILQQFQPEKFESLLNQGSAEVILSMLSHKGNELTSDQLEILLSPRFVPAEAWTKWWSKARSALKKHPRVRLTGRNPVVIQLETEEIPLEEEYWSKFNVHSDPKQWLDLVNDYLRACKDRQEKPRLDFLLKLRDAVAQQAGRLEKQHDAEALAAWLVYSDIGQLVGKPADYTGALCVLEEASSLQAIAKKLSHDVYWSALLDCIRSNRGETWQSDFCEILPFAPPSRCNEMAKDLERQDQIDSLNAVVDQIMSDPISHLPGLCWLYLGPSLKSERVSVPPLVTLLSRLLDVLDQVHQSKGMPSAEARYIRQHVRSAIMAQGASRFKECLEDMEAGMADAISTQIRRCVGLTDANKGDLNTLVRRRFPQFWKKKEIPIWEDDDVLLCTSSGFESKKAELDELVNVKMKENAKAIGEAASHGDLSENSEYKFALEERDLLRARHMEIQKQLSQARLISRNEIPTEQIGVGSRAILRNRDTQEDMALSFLGPWEANVDEGVLNYKAPISQRMMCKRLGDIVELDFAEKKGTFEIIRIEPCI